jgi:N-methylhydantoinase B
VNPQFPSAGGSRMLIGHYLPMLVLGCLGQVVPDRVIAACGSPMWGMNQSGVGSDGKPYANMFFFNGGMGASATRDGQSCLSWPSNLASTSIEIGEHAAPLRFRYKPLRRASGGIGRHRGGLGQEILMESRSASPIAVSFLAERTVVPAFGIAGGAAGAVGVVHINGAPVDPKRQHILQHGDTVLLATPGGGHGTPHGCDPAAVAHDLALGYAESSANQRHALR